MSPRGVVANLYVLKCRPGKVPPLAHSVPRRLHLAYGALGLVFCVLSLAFALFMQFCMPSFACGALGAELLRAQLCVVSFACCVGVSSFACPALRAEFSVLHVNLAT